MFIFLSHFTDIKKSFVQEPLGARVLKDNHVQLLCKAPPGDPDPEVYWERDGVRVDTQDRHYLQTQDGTLFIITAQVSDTGNYTCIAENIAGKRKSQTASVYVYGRYWALYSANLISSVFVCVWVCVCVCENPSYWFKFENTVYQIQGRIAESSSVITVYKILTAHEDNSKNYFPNKSDLETIYYFLRSK